MNRQIFLDMDGVIVNLHGSIARLHGLDDVIAFNRHELQLTRDELWSDTDIEWWATLPWMEDGREILTICEEAVGWDNLFLCSRPAPWPGGAEGKLQWIERELPQYRYRFILTCNKASCASGRTLLIDDTEREVQQFCAAGGASLLCPRPWNQLPSVDPVVFLRDRIAEMLE